jgi:peptidoglycan/LPS O-acetylase OafA/YrhL
VLRLWPAYLVVTALTAAVLLFLPLTNFFSLIRIPKTAVEIVSTFTILGQVTFDFLQWAPQAKLAVTSWSLSIELFSYVLLAMFFAQSSARLWCFAALGAAGILASTVWCAATATPLDYGPFCFQNRYGVLQAGFIPFAAGGFFLLSFHVDCSVDSPEPKPIFSSCLAFEGLMFTGDWFRVTAGPFCGVPLTYLMLTYGLGKKGSGFSDFFGRASYHLFIAHMGIAAVLVTGLQLKPNTFVVFAVTIAAALALSAGLVSMERRIETIRNAIKRQI